MLPLAPTPSILQPPLPTRRRLRRRPGPHRRPLLVAAVALAALPVAGLGVFQYWPGFAPVPVETRLVVGDYLGREPALVDGAGRVYVPFESLQAMFDQDISLDRDLQWVTIPTQGHPVEMATGQLTAFLAAKPATLNARIVTDADGVAYVPLDVFAALEKLEYDYHPESNTVVIDRAESEIQVGTVRNDETYVRQTPSLLSLKLSRLAKGDTVLVFGEKKGRYWVRDAAGRLGYIPSQDLDVGPSMPAPPKNDGRKTQLPSLDGRKLSVVWEAVSGANPDPATIADMPGLNVVSPTWFAVVDTEGTVRSLADATYVKWAHERGYRVWGLITNGFSQSRTRAFLPSAAMRESIIRQLLYYAKLYDLDGVNLDFESMYLSERDDYVALARELVPLAHAQGLTVSVDVSFLSSSELWSRCFDRPALSSLCDYVMVMAYDEHTSASSPGSVGSIPWVEYGLQRLLDEGQVPASKLVLGVPFYTRLFETRPGWRGQVTVYSMNGVRNLLAEKGLAPTWDGAAGQHYLEFTEDEWTNRLWIEDEESMSARVRLVHKYGLAGIAAWRRGFELPDIWPVIDRELNQKQ